MFQILTDEHPDDLRVQVSDLETARAWLGLPSGRGNSAGSTQPNGGSGHAKPFVRALDRAVSPFPKPLATVAARCGRTAPMDGW